MTRPTIRRATADDVAAIADVTRAAYAKWVPLIGREPLPMTVDYTAAFRSHRFDLLCEDGVVLGLVETLVQHRHLVIENVCVLPGAQGKGRGRRLIAHAERLAKDAGLAGVCLYTNGLFAQNLRLYAAFGYRVEREEPFKGGIIVHLTKAL